MQPIHAGRAYENLYNANAMQSVSICLDSGKVATAACYNDARGIQRVVDVLCYAEDIPEGTCDKHVSVHYCVTGGGVAGEYCSQFLDAEVGTRSLVKLTSAEIDEIKAAGRTGLVEAHLNSGYVYHVDGNGDGIGWSGFYGNGGGEAPYLICSLHTQDSLHEIMPPTDGDMGFGDGYQDNNFNNDDSFAFPDELEW